MVVARLTIGKTMIIVKSVLSAGENHPQKHHKFQKGYGIFVL